MPLVMNGFNQMNLTRKKFGSMVTKTSTGNGAQSLTWEFPRTGLLSEVYLRISAVLSGTLGAATAAGMGALINRVRIYNNNGLELFNNSGLGYAHMTRYMLGRENGTSVVPSNQGKTIASTATFNLDMYIPIQMNQLDPIGLILLQNDQVQLTLVVDMAASTSVAATTDVALSVTPYFSYFTVPTDPRLMPPLDVVHRISEDQTSIAATGEYIYDWQRGNTYVQLAHGLVLGHTPTNGTTQVALRANQADYIYNNLATAFYDVEYQAIHYAARGAGVTIFDFMGHSGLGNYGSPREYLNSALTTDIETVLQVGTTGTLYTVRRELLQVA